MGAEGRLEKREMHQKARAPDTDHFAISIHARAWNQNMQMRMELQLLSPSVENGNKAVDLGPEPLGRGKFFGKGLGNGGEKHVVKRFGIRTEKIVAQLLRQGEGNQKIGSVDLFFEAPLDPGSGGGLAAARTSPVIATMKSKMIGGTLRASKTGISHGRSAAMGDGPDGTTLNRS